MSTREFFLRTFRTERPKFLSVLRALPNDRLDYKPHEKNSSAGDIAWFLVLELRALVKMMETGEVHWEQPPNPKDVEAIVREYDTAAEAYEKALAAMDDATFDSDAHMYYGGKLMKTSPRGETAWDFLHDAIHHRGQLTAYLRPMGGKVPSIYGPTADSR
jgi:uncharacterized damage-inducible protein DinB